MTVRSRLIVCVLALAAVLAATPALAQGFGWFGGLFGGGGQQQNPGGGNGYGYGDGGGYQERPQYRRYRRSQSDDAATPRRRAPRKVAKDPAPTPDAAKPAPVKNATVFVDVYGDTYGQLLANGLDEALADKPEIGVVHLGRGPSGLVNTGYYDWDKTVADRLARVGKPDAAKPNGPAGAADKAAAQPSEKKTPDGSADKPLKIDVAVIMIGSNDRQPITDNGKRYQPGSEEWNAVYRKRALAIAEAFQKKKIPLVWVGIPIVKNGDFADDMAALNEIYRDVAARTGATYVDTWEAFSDANGDFSAYGPDISGQEVRLRTADGIFFTSAGARKLAHFVETHVRRDLDGKTPAPQLPTADTPSASVKDKKDEKSGTPVAVVKPEAGPIKNLTDQPAAKDGQLVEMPKFEASTTRAPDVDHKDTPPVERADNFRWPKDGAAAQ